jgi:PEP-CTERM motif
LNANFTNLCQINPELSTHIAGQLQAGRASSPPYASRGQGEPPAIDLASVGPDFDMIFTSLIDAENFFSANPALDLGPPSAGPSSAPEPSSLSLLVVGALGLGWMRWRHRTSAEG